MRVEVGGVAKERKGRASRERTTERKRVTHHITTFFSTLTSPPCSLASFDRAAFLTVLNVKSPASLIVAMQTPKEGNPELAREFRRVLSPSLFSLPLPSKSTMFARDSPSRNPFPDSPPIPPVEELSSLTYQTVFIAQKRRFW